MSVSISIRAVIVGKCVTSKSKLIYRSIKGQEKIVTCYAVFCKILCEFLRLAFLKECQSFFKLLNLKDLD